MSQVDIYFMKGVRHTHLSFALSAAIQWKHDNIVDLHSGYKTHIHTCTAGKAEGMHERDDVSGTAGRKDDRKSPSKQVQGKVQTGHCNMARVATQLRYTVQHLTYVYAL